MSRAAAVKKGRAGKKKKRRADIRKVIADARDAARPTDAQAARIKRLADMMLGLVSEEAAKHPEILDVEVGGSYRKGTWLAKPEMDVDIYLRFDRSTGQDRFKDVAIDVGRAALKDFAPYLKFSDHPYVEARLQKGVLANVVPCYDAEEGRWQSAADRSRFHVQYMTRKLTKKMRDDVRLLKSFLKANGLYGAQVATNGFSGYVAEVLVSHYGSFGGVVRAFARDVVPGSVIGRAAREFTGVISIIDPIDGNRNLAAAISSANIVRFVLACRAFVREPSADFFDGRRAKRSRRVARRHWDNLLVVRFGFGKRAPDVIWGQTKKSAAKLAKKMAQDGFAVHRHGAHVEIGEGRGYLFVLLGATEISPVYVQYGPEFSMSENLDAYIGKNLGDSEMMWVDAKGRLAALKKWDDSRADAHARRLLNRENAGGSADALLLPPGREGRPKVWIGSAADLGAAARGAAEELIATDAAIVRLS